MVADLTDWVQREPTGHVRIRMEKRRRWFGVRLIVEQEVLFEFTRWSAHTTVLRSESRWMRVRPWNFLGRNFYAEVRY